MEDINKGFIIGIIITLLIVFVFVPQSMSESCPQERLILDCEPELIEVYIADHPDVCDGLCAEQEKLYRCNSTVQNNRSYVECNLIQ